MQYHVPASEDAIGGYIGVEPSCAAGPWPWRGGLLFQSARAAFTAFLASTAPRTVWLPWFICGSMLEPLHRCGVAVRRYALREDFRIEAPPSLGHGEALVYVNYFGLCGDVEAELVATYPGDRLIFDHAQALYAPPGGVATLYSPRKFLGVPDGGVLMTSREVAAPDRVDDASLARIQARLLRTAAGAEAGFVAFQEAERSIDGQEPLGMSVLTRRLLGAVDHARVQELRRRNFDFVHQALGRHNRLRLRCEGGQVPLCYPFWPALPLSRAEFHRARVYLPVYWPELLEDPRVPPAERTWAAEWLHLPIDQRYDTATLQTYVVAPICAMLEERGAG